MLIFLDDETNPSPILLGHKTVFNDFSPKEQQCLLVKKVHSGFWRIIFFLRPLLCIILIEYIRNLSKTLNQFISVWTFGHRTVLFCSDNMCIGGKNLFLLYLIIVLRIEWMRTFFNVTCCSRLPLWVGYFMYFKLMCVLFYLMFLMDVLLQLKKSIWKAMCVLLFDVFNGCSTSVKEINR